MPDSNKRKLFLNYRQFRPNDSMDDSLIGINSHHQMLNDSIFDSPAYKERNLKLADVDKGLEVIGRGLAKDQNVGWKEHWDFLNDFLDIASAEGLEKFEKYLCTKEEQKKPLKFMAASKRISLAEIHEMSPLSSICRDLSKINYSRIWSKLIHGEDGGQRNDAAAAAPPSACNAYQCVEKSCQVFAKRLLKQIGQQSRNIAQINDALTCELNRLKSLVCSYKEDTRFFAVDFRSAHSRFAHLIVWFLKEDSSVIDTEVVNEFRTSLQHILDSKLKNSVADNAKASQQGNSQLLCLLRFLLQRLREKGMQNLDIPFIRTLRHNHVPSSLHSEYMIAPETLTTEQDCADVWSTETKCQCEWTLEQGGNKQIRAMKRRQENNKIDQIINDIIDVSAYRDTKESDDEDDEFYLVRLLPGHHDHD